MNQQKNDEAKQAYAHVITRDNILAEALKCTMQDRNAVYGEPYANLSHMAELVQSFLKARYSFDLPLTAGDMAMVMVLGKVARVGEGKFKLDNSVDGAAYFAIAGECDQIDIHYADPANAGQQA